MGLPIKALFAGLSGLPIVCLIPAAAPMVSLEPLRHGAGR